MKLVGKVAFFVATGSLLYGTSLLTRDRDNTTWSPIGAKEIASRPHAALIDALPASGARIMAQGQALTSDSAAENVLILQSAQAARQRKRASSPGPAFELATAERAKVEPVTVEPVKVASLRDPETTSGLVTTPESIKTEAARPAGVRPAVAHTPMLRGTAKLARPAARKAYARVDGQSPARVDGRRLGETRPRKNPLSAAVAQERPAAPLAAASEPIQFRLADRGN